jgi:hypothetical protein
MVRYEFKRMESELKAGEKKGERPVLAEVIKVCSRDQCLG